MPGHTRGLHHFYKRKHNKHTKLDSLVYIIAMFGIILTIPQVKNIWIDRNAAGVSAISWMAYAVTAGFWVAYGIAHKEKPIIFANVVWLVLDIMIAVGTLVYG